MKIYVICTWSREEERYLAETLFKNKKNAEEYLEREGYRADMVIQEWDTED